MVLDHVCVLAQQHLHQRFADEVAVGWPVTGHCQT